MHDPVTKSLLQKLERTEKKRKIAQDKLDKKTIAYNKIKEELKKCKEENKEISKKYKELYKLSKKWMEAMNETYWKLWKSQNILADAYRNLDNFSS